MANLGEQVKKMAQQSGLSLADYFDLLTIYYQVDAGSHTKDAGGLEALDYLLILITRKTRFVSRQLFKCG